MVSWCEGVNDDCPLLWDIRYYDMVSPIYIGS